MINFDKQAITPIGCASSILRNFNQTIIGCHNRCPISAGNVHATVSISHTTRNSRISGYRPDKVTIARLTNGSAILVHHTIHNDFRNRLGRYFFRQNDSLKFHAIHIIHNIRCNGLLACNTGLLDYFIDVYKRQAVVTLTFVFSVSVLAASFPPIQRLFERAGIQLSSIMQPIELSCVSNNIEMQVLAAVNDNERVTVYLALRDQSEKRINEKTVLSNLQITGTIGPCDVSLVDFDESTGISIYRLSSYGIDALDGKPITVEVRTLLNGMENSYRQNTGFPLSALEGQTPILKENVSLNSSAIVYDQNGNSPFNEKVPPLLEPSACLLYTSYASV